MGKTEFITCHYLEASLASCYPKESCHDRLFDPTIILAHPRSSYRFGGYVYHYAQRAGQSVGY
jgi:hypothetical protein